MIDHFGGKMTSRLIILALSLLAASATAQQSRIVGGWPADESEYRSIVQVDYYNIFSATWNQACAGLILNIRYVVSAAHCFQDEYRYRQLRGGSTYRNTGGVVKQVELVRVHPDFGQREYDADICLVRAATPWEYNEAIGPISIISQGTVIPDDTPVRIAGWGTTAPSPSVASPQLLETEVYKINVDLCRERYAQLEPEPAEVTENMICTGVLDKGGRDACQGDSGGPVLFRDILIGIISWGYSCAHPEYYGVNTAVASYTTWIVENSRY